MPGHTWLMRRGARGLDSALPQDPAAGGSPDLARVRRTASSVAVATGVYGVSFGALATTAGLGVLPTMALSLLMFTGGSQFAFIGVLGAGGAPVTAVATAGLLGARNALYGAALAPLLQLRGPRRWLGAHLTIDESMAVATAQPDPTAARHGFWWAGAGVFVVWNLCTLFGALAGDALGDPGRWGLDAAAGAAFLGLLWPRLGAGTARVVAAGAVAVALVLTPLLPAGIPVLVAGLVAVAGEAWSGRASGGPLRLLRRSGSDAPGVAPEGDEQMRGPSR